MSFADIKAQARRDVHAAFAVPGTLTRDATVFDVAVRFQDRIQTSPEPTGWSTIIEGVTRIAFNREQLATLALTPHQYDVVHLTDYGFSVKLQQRDPYDGPIDERWTVSPA